MDFGSSSPKHFAIFNIVFMMACCYGIINLDRWIVNFWSSFPLFFSTMYFMPMKNLLKKILSAWFVHRKFSPRILDGLRNQESELVTFISMVCFRCGSYIEYCHQHRVGGLVGDEYLFLASISGQVVRMEDSFGLLIEGIYVGIFGVLIFIVGLVKWTSTVPLVTRAGLMLIESMSLRLFTEEIDTKMAPRVDVSSLVGSKDGGSFSGSFAQLVFYIIVGGIEKILARRDCQRLASLRDASFFYRRSWRIKKIVVCGYKIMASGAEEVYLRYACGGQHRVGWQDVASGQLLSNARIVFRLFLKCLFARAVFASVCC